jgi:hypothetical protein
MNWYYFGLVTFFIIWELFYLYQRKHLKFFFGSCGLSEDGSDSWVAVKFIALCNFLMISCMLGLVALFVWAIWGVIVPTIITIVSIGLFFGLNYLFRQRKTKGRKK